jgi:hypothetical protein
LPIGSLNGVIFDAMVFGERDPKQYRPLVHHLGGRRFGCHPGSLFDCHLHFYLFCHGWSTLPLEEQL